MDLRTVSMLFHALAALMLSVWAVDAAQSRRGRLSMLVCGLLMAGLGSGMTTLG